MMTHLRPRSARAGWRVPVHFRGSAPQRWCATRSATPSVQPLHEPLMPPLIASEHALAGATATVSRLSRVREWTVGVVDAVILVYGMSLAVLMLTGGLDAGWLHIQHAAKPILILLLFVPVRIALGDQSWLLRPLRAMRDA